MDIMHATESHLQNYYSLGLKTFVIGMKELNASELGASAIEDKLQKGVPKSRVFEECRNSGIGISGTMPKRRRRKRLQF